MYDPNSAPVISDQTFTIAENSSNGTEVGTIVASDPESDDLTFSILSGNTDNAFSINSSTGLLTVNNSDALDYATTPSFSLSVQVSDGTLDANATVTVNLENTTSVGPIALNSKINVYPNPVTDILFITTPEYYTVEIYSVIGEKIYSTKENQIDLSALNAGVYFAVIKNDSGKSLKSIKILKK
ncbi:cadherin domain-containing protein [Bacteroidota bacterium]